MALHLPELLGLTGSYKHECQAKAAFDNNPFGEREEFAVLSIGLLSLRALRVYKVVLGILLKDSCRNWRWVTLLSSKLRRPVPKVHCTLRRHLLDSRRRTLDSSLICNICICIYLHIERARKREREREAQTKRSLHIHGDPALQKK